MNRRYDVFPLTTVPHYHDTILKKSVNNLCPNLPLKNKKYIINALRENYKHKGFIYRKLKSYECLFLHDLYSSYVADSRHKYTEYIRHNKSPSMHLFKKYYNNHVRAALTFGEYVHWNNFQNIKKEKGDNE